MDKFIDLFSRLIIATITFVGPLIILLLSTFSAGENRRNILAKANEDELSKRAAQELNDNPHTRRETIHKTSEELKKIEKSTKFELSKLNPITQFWHIYGSLAFSYILLSFSFLIRGNFWGLYNHNLSMAVIVLSFIAYTYSLFFIVRTFYTIIRTKKIIE